jgi:RimK family alpha-L-glutamate ligase
LNAWIIYNGSLQTEKMIQLVNHLVNTAKTLGINLVPIKNQMIIPVVQPSGKPDLIFLKKYPDPAFVLFWDKGTYLARVLEELEYPVHNSSSSIEMCDNKSLTHLELLKYELRVPKTIFGPFTYWENDISLAYAKKIFSNLGNEVILKESKGSFGMQVYKISTPEELIQKVKEIKNKDFIFQEYIHTSNGRDIRVNIIGNKIVGAMERVNPKDFRANITNGGVGHPIKLIKEQEELALAAHKALQLDFSGVDLMYGENDEPILCEVNSNVNFLSFEETTGIPYGKILLEYFSKKYR